MDVSKGSLVWIDSGSGYPLPAEVISFDLDTSLVKTRNEVNKEIMDVHLSKCSKRVAGQLLGVDDLTQLSELTDANILWNLKKRFDKNEIYTAIGGMLVSVNSYRKLSDRFPPEVLQGFRKATTKVLQESPHLYATGMRIYRAMVNQGENHSIVFTGESGSGKTESAKQLIHFYLNAVPLVPSNNRQQRPFLRNKELTNVELFPHTSIIVEAFAHAKTRLNDNASRMARITEIQCHQGLVGGASIQAFLLETSRSVVQGIGDRNFHIFYAMLNGLALDAKERFGLTTAGKYFYLNQSGVTEIPGRDEITEFDRIQASLDKLGFSGDHQHTIWRVLAAVLHLGNVYFKPKMISESQEIAVINNEAEIRWVAYLLQLDPKELQQKLTTKIVETKDGSSVVQLNIDRALDTRDGIAKTLYSQLVRWIIYRCNQKIQSMSMDSKICVVDMPGFENLKFNSLEQLCVNFTNETMHNKFLEIVFKAEQELYALEKIDWKSVIGGRLENQLVMDVIGKKPFGILHTLDVECNFPKGTEESLVLKCDHNMVDSGVYGKARGQEPEFMIKHYAGHVWYKAGGMLEKNREAFRPELVELLKRSQNPILAQVFGISHGHIDAIDQVLVSSKPNQGMITAASLYLKELQEMMQKLNRTRLNFVRCIRANSSKGPGKFDLGTVLSQIRALGLTDTVKARKLGYPIHIKFDEFVRRYRCLCDSEVTSGKLPKEATYYILTAQGYQVADQHQIGETMTFLRECLYDRLESQREHALERAATTIQKHARALQGKKNYARTLVSVVRIQAYVRGWLARLAYARLRAERMRALDSVPSKNAHVRSTAKIKDAVLGEDQFSKPSLLAKYSPLTSEIPLEPLAPVKHLDMPDDLETMLESDEFPEGAIVRAGMGTLANDSQFAMPHDVNSFPFNKFVELHFKNHAWQMRREPISAPFLFQEKESDYQMAIKMFKLILRFMNDTELNSVQQVALGNYIIQKALEISTIRDEIYCQIINQTHLNPKLQNAERGWTLLAACASVFPPSAQMLKYILNYVSSNEPGSTGSSSIRSMVLGKLLSAFHCEGTPSRHSPPTLLEWAGIIQKANIALKISCADYGNEVCQADSWMTSSNLAQRVLKQKGINANSGWTVGLHTANSEYLITGSDYLLDIISHWECPATLSGGKPPCLVVYRSDGRPGPPPPMQFHSRNRSSPDQVPPDPAGPISGSALNRRYLTIPRNKMLSPNDNETLNDLAQMERRLHPQESPSPISREHHTLKRPNRETKQSVDRDSIPSPPHEKSQGQSPASRPNVTEPSLPIPIDPSFHKQASPLPSYPMQNQPEYQHLETPMANPQMPSSSDTRSSNANRVPSATLPHKMSPHPTPPTSRNTPRHDGPIMDQYALVHRVRQAGTSSYGGGTIRDPSIPPAVVPPSNRPYSEDLDEGRSYVDPLYAAPSQISGIYGPRSDYSVVSMASEMRRVPLPSKNSDVDRYLDNLFEPVLKDQTLDDIYEGRSIAASIKGGGDYDIDGNNMTQSLPVSMLPSMMPTNQQAVSMALPTMGTLGSVGNIGSLSGGTVPGNAPAMFMMVPMSPDGRPQLSSMCNLPVGSNTPYSSLNFGNLGSMGNLGNIGNLGNLAGLNSMNALTPDQLGSIQSLVMSANGQMSGSNMMSPQVQFLPIQMPQIMQFPYGGGMVQGQLPQIAITPASGTPSIQTSFASSFQGSVDNNESIAMSNISPRSIVPPEPAFPAPEKPPSEPTQSYNAQTLPAKTRTVTESHIEVVQRDKRSIQDIEADRKFRQNNLTDDERSRLENTQGFYVGTMRPSTSNARYVPPTHQPQESYLNPSPQQQQQQQQQQQHQQQQQQQQQHQRQQQLQQQQQQQQQQLQVQGDDDGMGHTIKDAVLRGRQNASFSTVRPPKHYSRSPMAGGVDQQGDQVRRDYSASPSRTLDGRSGSINRQSPISPPPPALLPQGLPHPHQQVTTEVTHDRVESVESTKHRTSPSKPTTASHHFSGQPVLKPSSRRDTELEKREQEAIMLLQQKAANLPPPIDEVKLRRRRKEVEAEMESQRVASETLKRDTKRAIRADTLPTEPTAEDVIRPNVDMHGLRDRFEHDAAAAASHVQSPEYRSRTLQRRLDGGDGNEERDRFHRDGNATPVQSDFYNEDDERDYDDDEGGTTDGQDRYRSDLDDRSRQSSRHHHRHTTDGDDDTDSRFESTTDLEDTDFDVYRREHHKRRYYHDHSSHRGGRRDDEGLRGDTTADDDWVLEQDLRTIDRRRHLPPPSARILKQAQDLEGQILMSRRFERDQPPFSSDVIDGYKAGPLSPQIPQPNSVAMDPFSRMDTQAGKRKTPFYTYKDTSWNLYVRKEVFMPGESLNDPNVLDLIFYQVVRDVFYGNPFRIRRDERSRMLDIMESYGMHPDRLDQMTITLMQKRTIVEMAREWPLYFARLYPVVEARESEYVAQILGIHETGVRLITRNFDDDDEPLKVLDHFEYADLRSVELGEDDDQLIIRSKAGYVICLYTDKASQIKILLDEYVLGPSQGGSYVRATADYITKEANLLSLRRGDVVQLMPRLQDDYMGSGWLYGKLGNRYGNFPSTYAEPVTSEELARIDAGLPPSAVIKVSENQPFSPVEKSETPHPRVAEEPPPGATMDRLAGGANSGKLTMMEFAMRYFRQPNSAKIEALLTDNKKNKNATINRNDKKSAERQWTWKEIADLVKFSSSVITQSLLHLENPEYNRLAPECFIHIMQYMQDYPLKKSQTVADCVYELLTVCHKHPPLRDEVYCQIMKQTTNNKSTHPDSAVRGWRLFSILTAYFDCSEILKPYLVKYLTDAANDTRRAYHGTAAVCLQNLKKTFKYGGRKYLLGAKEIEAVTHGKNLKRQIYQLPGGTKKVINTKAVTVVEEVVQELCSELNVLSPLEQQEFCLCYVDESENIMKLLANDEYTLDVTTELENQQRNFFLLMKRTVWIHPLRLDNDLYIDVMYFQIVPDYLEGLLVIMKTHDSISASTMDDIALLGALLHRADEVNEGFVTERSVTHLLPRIVQNIRTVSPEQWADRVNAKLKSFPVHMTPVQSRAKFLEILQTWPLFGSTFFYIKSVFDSRITGDCFLAINKHGLLFLQTMTHENLMEFRLSEVLSTHKVTTNSPQSPDPLHFLDLKVGNLIQQRIVTIQTEQGPEISRLLGQYIFVDSQNRGFINGDGKIGVSA